MRSQIHLRAWDWNCGSRQQRVPKSAQVPEAVERASSFQKRLPKGKNIVETRKTSCIMVYHQELLPYVQAARGGLAHTDPNKCRLKYDCPATGAQLYTLFTILSANNL